MNSPPPTSPPQKAGEVMAKFTDLPFEMVAFIGRLLANDGEVNTLAALALTNHRCHEAVNQHLYRASVETQRQYCLFWAAKHGILSSVKMALKCKAEPNAVWWELSTPTELHQLGKLAEGTFTSSTPGDIARLYPPRLDLSIPEQDPNDSSDAWEDSGDKLLRYASPLHLAAMAGHVDIVRYLLDAGAWTETECRNLCTCEKMLMERDEFLEVNGDGKPVIIWDEYADDSDLKWTPLHLAICHRQLEVAKLLLSRRASLRWNANPIMRPLHLAAATGQLELVEHLLEGGYETNVDVEDGLGFTPLHWAVLHGYGSRVGQRLMQHGADVDWYINQTITLLSDSCLKDDSHDAQQLLQLGADPRAKHRGLMTLHWACLDLQLQDRHYTFRRFPRTRSEHEKKKEGVASPLVALLLDAGCPVDCMDEHSKTPLYYASANHLIGHMELLIHAGADVNAKAIAGVTPLMVLCAAHDICRGNPADEGFSILLSDTTAPGRLLDGLRLLLAAKADPNIISGHGLTALRLLCANPHVPMPCKADAVVMLLEAGADPELFSPLLPTLMTAEAHQFAAFVQGQPNAGLVWFGKPRQDVPSLPYTVWNGSATAYPILMDLLCGTTMKGPGFLVRDRIKLARLLFQRGARLQDHHIVQLFKTILEGSGTPLASRGLRLRCLFDMDINGVLLRNNGSGSCLDHIFAEGLQGRRTALIAYVASSSGPVSSQLPESKCRLNANRLLHAAIETCAPADVISTILGYGANPNATSTFSKWPGLLPLVSAVFYYVDGDDAVEEGDDIVPLLVEAGADVNQPSSVPLAARGNAKCSALELAFSKAKHGNVKTMLESSQDPLNTVPDTSLLLSAAVRAMFSSGADWTDVLENLLSHGADPARFVNPAATADEWVHTHDTALGQYLRRSAREPPAWILEQEDKTGAFLKHLRMLASATFSPEQQEYIRQCHQKAAGAMRRWMMYTRVECRDDGEVKFERADPF